MGAADRPHSSAMSSLTSSGYGGHRRPLSLAEGPLVSTLPTGSSSTTSSPSTSGSSIFRTLPSSKKGKRKVSTSPPNRLIEEETPSSAAYSDATSSRLARGQSECVEHNKPSPDGAYQTSFSSISAQNASPTQAASPAAQQSVLPIGHFLGRALNEDDSDDEQIREEICGLAAKFQSATAVLSSPSLTAVFINYLLVQNYDLTPTLFYLVAKHYRWMQTYSKEVSKDCLRVLMEIYTTFLHERAPLYVKLDSRVVQQMEDSVSTRDSITILDGCCEAVLPQIQLLVDKLSKDIRHGLDTWKPSECLDLTLSRSRDEELSIYETIISPRVNELQRIADGLNPVQFPSTSSSAAMSFISTTSAIIGWLSSTSAATEVPREQLALALCASLVSAYRFFSASITNVAPTSSGSPSQPETPGDDIFPGAAPTCPNTPAPPQHSFRKTLFAKSIENLAAASSQASGGSTLGSSNLSGSISGNLSAVGITNWDKLPSFNSKVKSKSSNALFGSWKSRHSQKGHSLQERIFDRVTECTVCGGLIWGLAPQGLTCQACDVSIHHRCKSSLKETCTKESKSSNLSRISVSNVSMSASAGTPPKISSFSVPRSSCSMNSPASVSQYPYLPEPTNSSGSRIYSSWTVRKRKGHHRPSLSAMLTAEPLVAASHNKSKHTSAGNFTSPLEDAASSGGRGDSRSSGLTASTEDIFHCRNSSFNELLSESVSGSPLQNPSFSPSEAPTSPIIDEETKVKRSNSGFSQTHYRGGSQAGLTSPEPISPLPEPMQSHFQLMRSSSQVLRKSHSRKKSLFSSTLNLSGYVRNAKQKMNNHSYNGTAAALSKHTTSLMQLPIMSDKELKRASAVSQFNPSASSSSAAANVPELLPTWSDDPEMNASESFEAENELRNHFPQYEIPTKGPRVQDHVRTLVLMEFHQKVRYMVCYLKTFDYLLLQRWPKEHQRLVDLMALDRIPRLIKLFRSLVHTIEKTMEPQGYGKMAEAVLQWLSKDDEANLKAWVRDCQALSCTNMLDSVKALVREYARKHPDIQPVLETRFNKFVLIECLSQVRILYFNLPLISNNIMKDLEKKTSSYKAEAKIWKDIYSKLVSIPHSIDKICMPLVKLFNDGHFFSTIDKGEQLTRHQAQFGNFPFADLMLQFPRTLFRYWVIDYSEIAVDKLTFTSDNKINYDYVKERTEVLAILLDSALILLVKDGGRYGLRPFKPTKEPGLENMTTSTVSASSTQSPIASNLLGNTMKLSPVFSTDFVFASLGEPTGQEYMLNLIFKEQAILLRLSFSSMDTREKWLRILKKREELSNQRRLATQKARASLPPVSMHSFSSDLKVDAESIKPIRSSIQSSSLLSESPQMQESEFPLDASSPEPMDKQITHFTGKISEVEQELPAVVRSISNTLGIDVNEILEKLSLKSGETVPLSNKELMVAELLMTENWLKFVKKHLRQLSHVHKWGSKEKLEPITIPTTSKPPISVEKGHHRSKSAIVAGLSDRRRRSRTRSGSNYSDCVETVVAKSSLEESKKKGLDSQEDELELGNEESKSCGRKQQIEMIRGLQNLSAVASRVLLRLGPKEKEEITVPEDSKSDEEQHEAFLDANSSFSSSSSNFITDEADEPRTNDFKNVRETASSEETLPSDYENEEVGVETGENTESREISEMVDYDEIPLKEPVSKLDGELIVPETPLATEEEECDDEEYVSLCQLQARSL
ncbi:unnamed protein product [Hymenolepis diminuta]|uniref:Phorbol-ester/DAG-type domain-containing protein n=1 Tax=Hymenolepis diminuta TaxID=6216 RepID=A0A564Z3S7_HYMDI|nr:unnamed protein product [Hymenolepis diminuta]